MYAEHINDEWLAGLAAHLNTRLRAEQGRGIRLIISEIDAAGIADDRQVAYILGTAWHESRFKPIREIRARRGTKAWRYQEAYWYSGYAGRGYVQITGRKNYRVFGRVLGIDLLGNPDLALVPEHSAKILVLGMAGGLFTGLALRHYFGPPPLVADWANARRIVNGTFHAGYVTAAALKILPLVGLLRP